MRHFLSLYVGLAGLLALLAGAAAAAEALTPSPLEELIVPHLDWSRCSEGSEFDCARAQVPLDYSDPGRRTIELALIRRKATGPGGRIGTLFFNPGGPGGPGTTALPGGFYDLFPREVRERFDIVSWDPRGVGESTAVRCFDSPEEARAWENRLPVAFPVGPRERRIWIAAYATYLRNGVDLGAAATLDQFLTLCGSTTPDRCAFSAGTPDATRTKFNELVRRLQEHPQGTWTYGKTVGTVVQNLYEVHQQWSPLATKLQDLWEHRTPQEPPPPPGHVPYPGFEQIDAVRCSESPTLVTRGATTPRRGSATPGPATSDASWHGPPRCVPHGRRQQTTPTPARGTAPPRTLSSWSTPPTTQPPLTRGHRP
jgi:hypothetical protein